MSPRAIDGGLSADGSRGGSPRESEAEVATAVAALVAARTRVSDLESRLEEADRRNSDLEEEVRELKEKLRGEGEKYSVLWRMNCAQLKQYDNMIAAKEEELLSMEARTTALEGSTPRGTGASPIEPVPPEGGAAAILSPTSSAHNAPGHVEPGHTGVVCRLTPSEERVPTTSSRTHLTHTPSTVGGSFSSHIHARSIELEKRSLLGGGMRRGKAPPVDSFSAEDSDIIWLPSLQRAADWNRWSERETLIQLAGYLCGRALQEWTLLRSSEEESLDAAIAALHSRLDPGSRALAAQDFRHAAQKRGEPVSDYIRRLEQLFRRAYGRDGMSDETQETFLHS